MFWRCSADAGLGTPISLSSQLVSTTHLVFPPKLHALFFFFHEHARQAILVTANFITLLHSHEIMDTCDMVYQQPSHLVQLEALVGNLSQGGRGIVCTCGDNVNTWCLYHFYLVLEL